MIDGHTFTNKNNMSFMPIEFVETCLLFLFSLLVVSFYATYVAIILGSFLVLGEVSQAIIAYLLTPIACRVYRLASPLPLPPSSPPLPSLQSVPMSPLSLDNDYVEVSTHEVSSTHEAVETISQ